MQEDPRESSGASIHIAIAAAVPMIITGTTAITTTRRASIRPPMARARDIHRVRPVSAPRRSKVFDKMVNSAISSNSAPAGL